MVGPWCFPTSPKGFLKERSERHDGDGHRAHLPTVRKAANRPRLSLSLDLPMSSDAFPDPVFESLLDKLVHTLEITQSSQSTLNPQTRQAIFQAVRMNFLLHSSSC